MAWNDYVASLSPWAWWKLDEGTNAEEGDSVADDASGNGRTGLYNGSSTFPEHRFSPLFDGSTYCVKTDAGSNVSSTFAGTLCNNESFTFGCWLRTVGTPTSVARLVRRRSAFEGLQVTVNSNIAGASAGALLFFYDSTGANANALEANATGWNDNVPHLCMFEYDETADRLAIWKDGVKIGDRARAGTKPTLTSNTYDWLFDSLAIDNVFADEYLFFQRVLTSSEHRRLAAIGVDPLWAGANAPMVMG